MDDQDHIFIRALRAALPTTFSRQVVARHLRGIYTVSTLANLDSIGAGPPKERIGRSVMYEKETFLLWLESRFIKENENPRLKRRKKSTGRASLLLEALERHKKMG